MARGCRCAPGWPGCPAGKLTPTNGEVSLSLLTTVATLRRTFREHTGWSLITTESASGAARHSPGLHGAPDEVEQLLGIQRR